MCVCVCVFVCLFRHVNSGILGSRETMDHDQESTLLFDLARFGEWFKRKKEEEEEEEEEGEEANLKQKCFFLLRKSG